jgi:hypothetical protein
MEKQLRWNLTVFVRKIRGAPFMAYKEKEKGAYESKKNETKGLNKGQE